MTRLFISLYLDEDVDVLLAALIRARGFEVETTQEAGQVGKTDEEQFAYATDRSKALLTHNRVDFERLASEYFENGRDHSGILIAVRRHTYELALRTLTLLNSVTADEMRNQIRYL